MFVTTDVIRRGEKSKFSIQFWRVFLIKNHDKTNLKKLTKI
jgi:hypothetical protein